MSPPVISQTQVDEALAGAEAAVSRLGSVLFDLEGDITRRLLDESTLSGRTDTEWKVAGDRIGVLWSWFGALSAQVDACRERRGQGRLKDRELAELAAALNAPSITLPPESVRLAAACMPEVRLSDPCAIRPLVDALSITYQAVAELVARVSAAWDQGLPRLDELSSALDTAVGAASRAGVRAPNEAAPAQRRLGELRTLVGSDPLAFDPAVVGPVAEAVERVRVAVSDAVAARGDLSGDLDLVDGVLRQAALDADQAIRRHAEAVEKVAPLESLSAPLAALTTEIGRSQAVLTALRDPSADWQDSARGLRALQPRAAAAADEARRLAAAAAAPLDARRELRGRLDAYRAKAQSVGRAEDLALEERYQAAQTCLYTSPCDLDQARRLVAAYQEGFRSPAADSQAGKEDSAPGNEVRP